MANRQIDWPCAVNTARSHTKPPRPGARDRWTILNRPRAANAARPG
jgi:hypothetical protein